MDVFKRYAISFSIAGILLYFFTIWVEKKNDGMMPHNLSNKTEEKLAVTLPPKRYYEKCLDLSETQQLIFNFNSQAHFPLTCTIMMKVRYITKLRRIQLQNLITHLNREKEHITV